MRHGGHWQPKDRKEDMANDVQEWARKATGDPTLCLASLVNMTYADLCMLMIATHDAERRARYNPGLDEALNSGDGTYRP